METGAPRSGSEPSQCQSGLSVSGRRSTLLLGASDTGKTIFALQAVVSAARDGEPGIFVGIGELEEGILALGQSFGWDLPKLKSEKLLAIYSPGAGESLTSITADALALAARLRATRVAMDSVHLATAPATTAEQLRELVQVRDSLLAHGLTSVFTCSTDSDAVTRCAALMQSLTDCTVWLEAQPEACGVKRLLRVVRYRAAPFPQWDFPFAIGGGGIELALPGEQVTPGPVGPELPAELEMVKRRLSTGLHALDRFLEMKQAELDFLLQKDAQQHQPAPAPEVKKPTARPEPPPRGAPGL